MSDKISLPIDADLPRIVAAMHGARNLVIVAPPGAGKTTRVPVALLEGRIAPAEHPAIIMLQPRRVAARAAAARIAFENKWDIGREVGYHVRFDRRLGRSTLIRVLTEGILSRQLLEDPYLEGVGIVILDEFHERSLHSDLAIALLREVQETVRPDLKIVVMSATIAAEPVAAFLGNCPIVTTRGAAYPIDIEYAPAVRGREEEVAIGIAEEIVCGSPPAAGRGDNRDILIFMPGAEEIRRVIRGLDGTAARLDVALHALHGSLTLEEQDRAITPDPQGRRKVIVATNVAETSLTIEGVGVVIDSGLARVAGYDPQRGLDRLEVQRISRASATQRAGRSGRTGPGRCVRLWSEKEWERMDEFDLPEVQRVDLCATVLELAAWGKSDPRTFGWFEAPEARMLGAARDLLAMLGAVQSSGEITPIGRELARLPVHPRLGRLLLEARQRNIARTGATLAALISEKDILRFERHERGSLLARQDQVAARSDLLLRLHLLEESARDGRLDRFAVKQVLRVREELIRVMEERGTHLKKDVGPRMKDESEKGSGFRVQGSERTAGNWQLTSASSVEPTTGNSAGGLLKSAIGGPSDSSFLPHPSSFDEEELLRLVLWAYPDRVCRRRGGQDRGVMEGGGGVKLAAESVVTREEFFVAVDARQDQRSAYREALVRIASAIDPAWLEEMFPQQIRRERTAEFDQARQRIVGAVRLFYRDLLLREDKDVAVTPEIAREMLGEVVRNQAGQIFRENGSAAGVLDRVALLRQHMPGHPWPTWSDQELGEVLAASLGSSRSLDDVRRLPLAAILKAQLRYPLDRLLETEAPEAMEVPSGSHIRLRYGGGEAVLAARLQELFGWTDTPRIAGGRVPVKLELLAPNFRPVQVTMDLRSFWSTTYFQVKKDLKARYPRHAWPEEPLMAKAEAKGGRRKS